uniref:Uncharacterized protein n=1 Tax=Faecalibaculum rodentium TaxID=1702221 RepID=A0A140DYL6_9FIRM|nr:hypothetical protein AALO17_26090 [Faecalibaculum rodentium]
MLLTKHGPVHDLSSPVPLLSKTAGGCMSGHRLKTCPAF